MTADRVYVPLAIGCAGVFVICKVRFDPLFGWVPETTRCHMGLKAAVMQHLQRHVMLADEAEGTATFLCVLAYNKLLTVGTWY